MTSFFDALLFPKERQERDPDPGPFTDHRPYKRHLQKIFRSKCVYCRISDGLQGYESFGIDHYLPKSKFPQLIAAWPNLFYACNVCNIWKGESVSTPERFLPNPCDHPMADHLQYRGADIETYTPHGEWLAELLHLPERRSLREFILSALANFLTARNELVGELITYEARIDDLEGDEERPMLQTAIQKTVKELEQVNRHIERLTGEPVSSSLL